MWAMVEREAAGSKESATASAAALTAPHTCAATGGKELDSVPCVQASSSPMGGARVVGACGSARVARGGRGGAAGDEGGRDGAAGCWRPTGLERERVSGEPDEEGWSKTAARGWTAPATRGHEGKRPVGRAAGATETAPGWAGCQGCGTALGSEAATARVRGAAVGTAAVARGLICVGTAGGWLEAAAWSTCAAGTTCGVHRPRASGR